MLKTSKKLIKVVGKTEDGTKESVNLEPEKCFWLYDGQVLRNLEELSQALEKMSDEVFKYHANKEKNDFANWVENIFGDRKLASDLKKVKTAKTAAKKVKIRIQ